MNSVTIRFLETYEHLKKTKIVKNPTAFAEKLNVSTSLITEICKKRTNAGITPIQNLVQQFNDIDANWLLTGRGSMLKTQNTESENDLNFKELAEARLEIIEMKNDKIATLTKEIKQLKASKK
ncbi:hypothetical protein [Flavobacterium sp. 1355]|uniref:hypothetical protein n=1 Tax=Flavobacterium sp. 1355 TaxID=2806571 RepID=UPI001AE5DB43|nr:hypothetical protein [Flavobacterium sp. 1355]MBP1222843.1 hypothetical protein [Flavobacterium sp. 1355]